MYVRVCGKNVCACVCENDVCVWVERMCVHVSVCEVCGVHVSVCEVCVLMCVHGVHVSEVVCVLMCVC